MARIVPCPDCDDGREIRAGIVYEIGCGHPHIGEVDRGSCQTCGGAQVIEMEEFEVARTLEDLENEDFMMMEGLGR